MKTKNIPWALVEDLLTAREKSRDWLRDGLKVENQAITNWKSRGVPRGRAAEIAALLKTSADYLLQVPGAQRDTQSTTNPILNAPSDVEPAPTIRATPRLLPVVGRVQAGSDGLLNIDDYPVGQGDGVVEYWATCENAYALRVRGESMSPRYLPGEFVAVDPCSEVQPSQEVIVLLRDGRRMIKRLLWLREGQASFESINKDYQNIVVELEEIEGLHKVLGRVPPEAFKPREE